MRAGEHESTGRRLEQARGLGQVVIPCGDQNVHATGTGNPATTTNRPLEYGFSRGRGTSRLLGNLIAYRTVSLTDWPTA